MSYQVKILTIPVQIDFLDGHDGKIGIKIGGIITDENHNIVLANKLLISEVIPGSPADGKLHIGDEIIEYDGKNVEGYSTEDWQDLMIEVKVKYKRIADEKRMSQLRKVGIESGLEMQ